MNVTPRQRLIILGILADLEQLSPMPIPTGYDTHEQRAAIEFARNSIVRSEPSRWLRMGLTPSLHVMLSRDYRRLESLGLIERLALGFDGVRQTHLKLTDTGRKMAEQLRTTKAPTDG